MHSTIKLPHRLPQILAEVEPYGSANALASTLFVASSSTSRRARLDPSGTEENLNETKLFEHLLSPHRSTKEIASTRILAVSTECMEKFRNVCQGIEEALRILYITDDSAIPLVALRSLFANKQGDTYIALVDASLRLRLTRNASNYGLTHRVQTEFRQSVLTFASALAHLWQEHQNVLLQEAAVLRVSREQRGHASTSLHLGILHSLPKNSSPIARVHLATSGLAAASTVTSGSTVNRFLAVLDGVLKEDHVALEDQAALLFEVVSQLPTSHQLPLITVLRRLDQLNDTSRTDSYIFSRMIAADEPNTARWTELLRLPVHRGRRQLLRAIKTFLNNWERLNHAEEVFHEVLDSFLKGVQSGTYQVSPSLFGDLLLLKSASDHPKFLAANTLGALRAKERAQPPTKQRLQFLGWSGVVLGDYLKDQVVRKRVRIPHHRSEGSTDNFGPDHTTQLLRTILNWRLDQLTAPYIWSELLKRGSEENRKHIIWLLKEVGVPFPSPDFRPVSGQTRSVLMGKDDELSRLYASMVEEVESLLIKLAGQEPEDTIDEVLLGSLPNIFGNERLTSPIATMFIKTNLDQFRNGLFERRIKEILKYLEARPAVFGVGFQRVLEDIVRASPFDESMVDDRGELMRVNRMQSSICLVSAEVGYGAYKVLQKIQRQTKPTSL